MKLSPITWRDVRLSNIEYYPRSSEETLAFDANVEFRGDATSVNNDGRGGAHRYGNYKLSRELDKYARTLPPYRSQYGDLPMNGDFLLSLMLEKAIALHEEKRARKKRGGLGDFEPGETVRVRHTHGYKSFRGDRGTIEKYVPFNKYYVNLDRHGRQLVSSEDLERSR